MNYVQYEFFTTDEIERDWLISILTDFHFEGFEETTKSLKAFVPEEHTRNLHLKDILYDNDLYHIIFETTTIGNRNWNEEWEKNFQPITIAGKVGVRAPFHAALNTEIELVIEPKMSFGTGHHSTTALMVELMLKENFEKKTVLDFGSGTGILAILAEKLKASKIVAIDNEEWAYNNCVENTARNGCVKIECLHGDEGHLFYQNFDFILANINRHVILKNMATWTGYLKKKSVMLVSGILVNDENDIIAEATANKLKVKEVKRDAGWVAISFSKG